MERIGSQKFLILSLVASGLIIIGANAFGQEIAILAGNYLYIPITGIFVVLSIMISLRYRTKGVHGKAWFLFAIFACSWFIAEMTWLVLEEVLEIDPYPSIGDVFFFF